MSNNPTNFRLTDVCLRLIAGLSEALGLKRSAVIELSVRELAKKHGVRE
jgi:hypothetical protein